MESLSPQPETLEFHVAPDGHDDTPGTPDAPVASLDAARDRVRAEREARVARGEAALPPGGATVWIQPGLYTLKRTFRVSAEDSGAKDQPIVYRGADPTNQPVLSGAHRLDPKSFGPVHDQDDVRRMLPEARPHVVMLDLDGAGVDDVGALTPQARNGGAMAELFMNHERLPLAQWPNDEWARTGRVIDKGSVPRWGDNESRPGRFIFDNPRIGRWTTADQAWLLGYWVHDWADDAIGIARLDTETGEIALDGPHAYGIEENRRFRIMNLLEEISHPGEWFLDRTSNRLYVWPPEGFEDSTLDLSLLPDLLIEAHEASNILFRDLTLEGCQVDAVRFEHCENAVLAGCTVRCVGGGGVTVAGGRESGVQGSEICETGRRGIALSGGDRQTLEPAGLFSINNHIHHFARRKRTYEPAVSIGGVGNRVAHCLIHDAPHAAILYGGNDHVMELNEIHDVCLETSDVGVFYCGRDWTIRGNVVRHNYVHGIPSNEGHGSMSVYLDDCASSTDIIGNVFVETTRSAFVGGGRDNLIEGNVFIRCRPAIDIDTRGLDWASKYQVEGGDHRMYEKLRAVGHDRPPYSIRYSALARILNENPHAPMGNVIRNNISWGGEWARYPEEYTTVGSNLVTEDDPGFIDAQAGDWRLREDSRVWRELPDLQPIPFEEIGLREGPFRMKRPESR